MADERVWRRFPKTAQEFEAAFPDEAACRQLLIELRWGGRPVCVRCGSDQTWELANGRFECRSCGRQMSVTAGTPLQGTRKPLRLWFRALWEMTARKNGCAGTAARPKRPPPLSLAMPRQLLATCDRTARSLKVTSWSMTRTSGRRESVRDVLVSRRLRSSWPQRMAAASGLSTHRISPPVRFDRSSNATSAEGRVSPPMATARTTGRPSAGGDTIRSSSNGFPEDPGIRFRTPTTRSLWSGDSGLARTTAQSVENTSRPTSTNSSFATTAARLAALAASSPVSWKSSFIASRSPTGRSCSQPHTPDLRQPE